MLHIVTVATKNEGYFNSLVESCNRNGGKLEVLGWGEKWQGHSQKLKLMHEYLQKLDDDDIVCFVDGYDVIILQPVEKLEKLFKEFGAKIVVSRDIETENSPVLSMIGHMYYGKCKNYPINSGTYMGYVKYLKILLDDILTNYNLDENKDDQILFTKICNKNNDVVIDIDRKIFLVIGNMDKNLKKITFQNNQLKLGSAYPCILHGAGNYNLDDILQKLGYNVKNNKRTSIHYYSNVVVAAYIAKILIYIIVIAIILIIIYTLYNNRRYLSKLKFKF